MLNSNLIHNVLNIVIVAMSMGEAGLLATGCTQTLTGFDCSLSWLPPAYVGVAVSFLGMLKLGMNLNRDGFLGMFKQQPPVNK